MDAFATRLAHVAVTVFFWPLVYAVGLGSGIFVIRHLSWIPILYTNKAPLPDTVKMVIWSGVALALVGLCYAAIIAIFRMRARGRGEIPPARLAITHQINRRALPLLALPFVEVLSFANIERDSPKETFFLIACAAATVGFGAYAWFQPAPLSDGLDVDAPPPARPGRERAARIASGAFVIALWIAYGAFFSYLAITNHRALNTRTIDLGYYDNIFYQSIHGRPLGCSFIKAGYHGSAHFDPILVVLSPLYLLYPRAEFLLILQSVWVGAGVVPAYLIAKRKLDSRLAGVALAAMYAIYPAIHGATLYEFHSLTLLTPILLWLLYCLERPAHRAYWALLLPTLMVREDVALVMCFVGAYAILSRRPGYARVGWTTILVSLFYFGIVKRFAMVSPDIFNSGGKESYSFAYYYDELIPNHNGMAGFLVSLVTNPVFVLKLMLQEAKILFLITLFLPLGFMPFLAKPGRVMLVYGLIFCLLASRTAVFSIHFQYSSVLIPIGFLLTPIALKQLEDGPIVRALGLDGRRLWRAVLAFSFAASLLVSWKFGGVLDNGSFRGGFARVARGLTDKDREMWTWVQKQVAQIPPYATVGATNRTGVHVSNRKAAFFYPEHTNVDFIFIDEGELKQPDLDKITAQVRAGELELVGKRDKLVLYKRRPKKP
jgi:uncharacterized membrane protein